MAKKNSKTKKGAIFYRADLHIHSPSSLDFADKTVPSEQIVRNAIEKKLDLIAITDHNTINKCYDVIEAAKGSPLVVLPGVEISVQGGERGIHLLALFDHTTPKEKVQDMLARIGISSDKRGKQEALTDKSIPEVLDEVQMAGGIIIAGHTDESNGLTNDIRGQQRIRILQNEKLSALEIVHKETSQHFNGTDPNYKRKLPCIQCSDAHSLSEIGRRVTRLKMDKPCLEGIRQAFLDQESRIRLDEPKLEPYPSVVGLFVRGGFLDGQEIHFNKNLNCLIGGRGTGKSTVIELIRFCLDALPPSTMFRNRRLEMIKHVLAEGEVSVSIQTEEGTIYQIRRKFGEHPRVYTEKNGEISVTPTSLFQIVSYGETEIEQISYDISSQLDLIDKFSEGLDKFKVIENEILKKLQKNADSILRNEKNVLDIETKLQELPSVKEMLKVLKKYKFDTKLEQQRKRGEEKALIKKIESACSDFSGKLTKLTLVDDVSQVLVELPSSDLIEQMPNKTILIKAVNHFKRLHSHVSKNFEVEKDYVLKITTKIERISEELQRKHRIQEEPTLKLFKKLEAAGESEAARRYLALQKKKLELEGLQSQISILKRHITKLEQERTTFLNQLEQTRDQIFEKRKQCASYLSKMLGPKIRIELEKGGNTEEYYDTLKDALKGSRVYSKDIEKIVKNISPFEFFEMVKEKRTDDFVKRIDITDHWVDAIIHFEQLRERLYEIQQVPLPDMPKILLEVGGVEKSLDRTSLGQRCTTLLSLVMLETKVPLIVDTPEEGLDNIFVFDSVVKNLRSIKEKRQLILATHNANIPVSGDSELIICMESDGKNGWISCRGSIDEEEMKERVQQVLEGGKEAFILRKRKYGY